MESCSICGPSPHTMVYRIVNRFSLKSYVGIATDPRRRYLQHRKTPPPRMAEDARLYEPFEEAFQLRIIQVCGTPLEAKIQERRWIAHFDAQGQGGYNTLDGHPPSTRRGWAVIRGARKAKRKG